jgi:hypothetical protein
MKGFDLSRRDAQQNLLTIYLDKDDFVTKTKGKGFLNLDASTQIRKISPHAVAGQSPKDHPEQGKDNENT